MPTFPGTAREGDGDGTRDPPVMIGSTIIVQSGDAAAAWAAALGAVGAAAAAGVITYLVTNRRVAADDRRWYANQEAVRRAATANRLRDIYAKIVLAAAVLQTVIGERAYLLEGETLQERDDRHDKMVTGALNTVSTVGGQLLVEDAASEVRKTYETLVSLIQPYFSTEAGMPAGPARADRLKALVDSIVAMVDKLLAQARTHLAELERTVRVDELAG